MVRYKRWSFYVGIKSCLKIQCLVTFFRLQSNGEGPKRIPVSQQSHVTQMAVVTPTQHQRVLGLSNGPQRIQRPVSHQKPASHVSVAVKSTHPADQNVNPAAPRGNPTPQPKHVSQQNQPKKNVPKVNPEPAKPPSESAKQEKPQSKYNTKLDNLIKSVCVLNAKVCAF